MAARHASTPDFTVRDRDRALLRLITNLARAVHASPMSAVDKLRALEAINQFRSETAIRLGVFKPEADLKPPVPRGSAIR